MTSRDRWWGHHDILALGSLLHHILQSLKVSLQLLSNDYAHWHSIVLRVQMITHIGIALYFVYKWLRTLAWYCTSCTNDYAHWHGIVLRVQMITHIGMALYFVYKWLRTLAWYCTCTSCTTMCAWGFGTQPYGIAQIHSCFVNNISNFSFEF